MEHSNNSTPKTTACRSDAVRTLGQCTVHRNGDIEVTHPNGFVYKIDSETLVYEGWLYHMSVKRWVDMDDFNDAYVFALRATGQSKEVRRIKDHMRYMRERSLRLERARVYRISNPDYHKSWRQAKAMKAMGY